MISSTETQVKCYHCGDDCPDESILSEDKHFCCQGCRTVYEILEENNLCTYYDLNQNAGVSLKSGDHKGKFDYLDQAEIVTQLLDYQSDTVSKITLYIPAVHCSSCVWLLENFHKIKKGVVSSRLNFLKKELSLSFDSRQVSLKEIAGLLTTLGYEPQISLQSREKSTVKNNVQRNLILRIGVVGFCTGNIMLMSFPEYFHLDLQNKVDSTYQGFFLYFNFILALPVFFYGASDYFKSAWISIREYFKNTDSVFSVDIPIALGITALFGRSVYETFANHSAGYYDSLAGLVFFLLTGRWIQQVTYNYLSFERNYKSYFPLAVKTLRDQKEQFINVSQLEKGDIILIHHQELIPADAILSSGKGLIDYSFVSGETDPQSRRPGDLIYAGGRQKGGQLQLVVQKPVSQSYLTQLWNNQAFKEEKVMPTTELANAFSKYFTVITLLIATITGIYWYINNPEVMLNSVTAVLMVACPCALTLSMPFTMGTTMGIFGRNKFYVKNQGVIQLLNEIDGIVFDKTGTLTRNNSEKIIFKGKPLTENEKNLVAHLCSASAHPLSQMIARDLGQQEKLTTDYFKETEGQGIEGRIDGHLIRLGKRGFIEVPDLDPLVRHTHSYLSIDGMLCGCFVAEPVFRPHWQKVIKKLSRSFKLFLLSGDNDAEKDKLQPCFDQHSVKFHQTPQDKLDFIRQKQEENMHILMIGDGLNDAGALRQSHVGIAISEDVKVFTPACDAILDASVFDRLNDFLGFSKTAINIVKASFILSLVYNFIGIGWAVSGQLSPVMAAIFMPLSSISVVLFATGLTHLFAWLKGFYRIPASDANLRSL